MKTVVRYCDCGQKVKVKYFKGAISAQFKVGSKSVQSCPSCGKAFEYSTSFWRREPKLILHELRQAYLGFYLADKIALKQFHEVRMDIGRLLGEERVNQSKDAGQVETRGQSPLSIERDPEMCRRWIAYLEEQLRVAQAILARIDAPNSRAESTTDPISPS